MSIRKHWRYLSYVVRHKWYVFRASCRLGVPWLGIIHDLSKFNPSEWRPYAERFYGGPHQPWAEVSGYGKFHHYDFEWRRSKEGVQEAFDYAWLRHIHRNKHHVQYWVLRQDTDGIVCLPIPRRYLLEMLADWEGAREAGAEGAKATTREWWLVNRDRSGYAMHPISRAEVDQLLGLTAGESAQ